MFHFRHLYPPIAFVAIDFIILYSDFRTVIKFPADRDKASAHNFFAAFETGSNLHIIVVGYPAFHR